VLRTRLDRARARDDQRDWVQDRRARTRQLIELGGLVQKAGLVELVDDDRAILLGALLEIAGWLQEDKRQEEATDLKARWRRRGLRAFDADAAATGKNQGHTGAANRGRPLGLKDEGQLGKEAPQ